MNCFRVQSLLSAYVDQELSTEDRRLMRAHLFNCPECSREMESLVLVKNLMGRLSAPEIPGDSLRLVHEELRGMVNPNFNSSGLPFFHMRHIMMTAACISLFLMTSTLIFPRIQNNEVLQVRDIPAAEKHTDRDVMASSTETEEVPQVQIVSDDEQNMKKKEHSPELFNRLQLSPVLSGTPVSR